MKNILKIFSKLTIATFVVVAGIFLFAGSFFTVLYIMDTPEDEKYEQELARKYQQDTLKLVDTNR